MLLYLIQESTLYLVALSSFRCMQQILTNSLFIFILLQLFSNFVMAFLDTRIIYKWTFNFQIHGILFKVSLILISHFDTYFSFKCFLLFNHPVFCSLTLLRLLKAKLKISLGKCHIALENMWFIFNYLSTLISNIIPQ